MANWACVPFISLRFHNSPLVIVCPGVIELITPFSVCILIHAVRVPLLLPILSGIKSNSGGEKNPLYLHLGRKLSKPLQGEYKVIFTGAVNNFTPCWAAERCYFQSSHILDACFDFLWKKPPPLSSHSGLAPSRRWTPSAPAYCRRMCRTCLPKPSMSTCKGKSYSTRLFFLEKIHLTLTPVGEMSLFMKSVIYSNAIPEAEMPRGAHHSDRSQGQAWAAACQQNRCLIEVI